MFLYITIIFTLVCKALELDKQIKILKNLCCELEKHLIFILAYFSSLTY